MQFASSLFLSLKWLSSLLSEAISFYIIYLKEGVQMNDYSDGIEYLHSLGLPLELCERICGKFEANQDMEGLVDYMLLCETMVDSCVD